MRTINVKKNCANYRERITECRRCKGGDAPYKECYTAKYFSRLHILILGFLLLPALASGYTIKATGHIRVRIVEPEIVQTQTVVYTEVGPTAQVVF